MSTTVTFKLNKDAHQFQAGDSVGFGIRGGVQYYDRQTKTKEWTNYDAALFAKDDQVNFYQNALVEGAIVSVAGSGILVVKQEGYGDKLEIQNARLEYVGVGQAAPQAQRLPTPASSADST